MLPCEIYRNVRTADAVGVRIFKLQHLGPVHSIF